MQPGTTNISITGHTPAPSYVGQPVEVSFALSVEPPAGGTPTGVVTVTDGTASCTATLPASRCSLTLLTAGSYTLVATYSGNNSFLPSPSPAVPHSVQPGATGIAIVGHLPDPSFEGESCIGFRRSDGHPTGQRHTYRHRDSYLWRRQLYGHPAGLWLQS